jgi:uncharacterized protein
MLQLIRAAEYIEKPWKNGGGLTYEIAAADLWRVSIATIDRDGPFSEYRGFDRTILAIDGDSVELQIGGATIRLARFQPVAFRGEDPVDARVRGSARDLNVMSRRDAIAHDVEVVTGRQRFLLDEDEFAFVYALDAPACVNGVALQHGDTLRIAGTEAFDVESESHAAVIRITETG